LQNALDEVERMRSFLEDNMEVLQNISLVVLRVLAVCRKQLQSFAPTGANQKFILVWKNLLIQIHSKKERELYFTTKLQSEKTLKKEEKQNKSNKSNKENTHESMEAGAPEPKETTKKNTQAPVPKQNIKKENETSEIMGAKTNKDAKKDAGKRKGKK
jgi:hypothetical protein